MRRVVYRETAFKYESVKPLLRSFSRTPVILKGVFNVDQLDALFRLNQNIPILILYAAALALGVLRFSKFQIW